MGMNYYWYEKPACPCCNRDFDGIHIGKSSGGWYFSLHVDSGWEDIPNSLEEWKMLFSTPGSVIKDEYGKIITVDEMLNIITNRKGEVAVVNSRDAVLGAGLLRHKIDGWFCVGGNRNFDSIMQDIEVIGNIHEQEE